MPSDLISTYEERRRHKREIREIMKAKNVNWTTAIRIWEKLWKENEVERDDGF